MRHEDFRRIRTIYHPPTISRNDPTYNLRLAELHDALGLIANITSVSRMLDTLFGRLLTPQSEMAPDALPINPDMVDRLITSIRNAKAGGDFKGAFFVVAVIASIFVEIEDNNYDIFPDVFGEIPQEMALLLSREISTYIAFKAADQAYRAESGGPISNLTKLHDTYVERLTQDAQELENAKGELVKLVSEHHDELESIRSEGGEIRTTLAKIDKETATTRENLKAFTDAIRESTAFRSSGDEWQSRAWWSSLAFYGSLAFMASVMLGGPIVVFLYFTEIQSYIDAYSARLAAELSTGGTSQIALVSLNRIAFLVAPAALVIWFVRIVVRYNMHALANANDARLRSSMIKMFVYLIEKKVASPDDRKALLEALVRPPPGQSSESIELPSIIEVIKEVKPS